MKPSRIRTLDKVIRRIKAEPWSTIPELAALVELSPRRIAAWLMVLEARIGAQNMEIWMAQARVTLVSPQLVRLEMESRYYLDWIRDNLGRVVEPAWAEALGVAPVVAMEVAPVAEVGRPVLRVVGGRGLPLEASA